MIDRQTAEFYDRSAEDYADKLARPGKPDRDLAAFVEAVAPGGRVLDLGCGPGRSAALLRDAGLTVEATDASPGMVRLARERFGIEARIARFDELDAVARYDGVFANFSLLHAPRAELPGHLARIRRSLKHGGVLHLGLKLGDGEARDELGRFYAYVSEAELGEWLAAAGFAVLTSRTVEIKGMTGVPEPAIILLARAESDA